MCFGNSGKFSLFNLLIWNQFESLVHLDLEKSLKWLGWHPPFGVTSDHVTNRNKSGEQHLGKTSQATPATWHELLNHQLLKFSLKGLEYKVSKVAVARAMKVTSLSLHQISACQCWVWTEFSTFSASIVYNDCLFFFIKRVGSKSSGKAWGERWHAFDVPLANQRSIQNMAYKPTSAI